MQILKKSKAGCVPWHCSVLKLFQWLLLPLPTPSTSSLNIKVVTFMLSNQHVSQKFLKYILNCGSHQQMPWSIKQCDFFKGNFILETQMFSWLHWRPFSSGVSAWFLHQIRYFVCFVKHCQFHFLLRKQYLQNPDKFCLSNLSTENKLRKNLNTFMYIWE